MEGKNYIIQWRIDNFSCWNLELHGKCITSPKSECNNIIMKLYPRGISGLETDMEVHFHITDPQGDLSGELLFIGSNGSTLFRQPLEGKEEDIHLRPGPKFEEVILNIRENQFDCMDLITLLLLAKRERWYTGIIHTVTKIDVFQVNLKLNPSNLIQCSSSSIKYIQDEQNINLRLSINRTNEEGKIAFVLRANDACSKFPFSVHTDLSLMSKFGSLLTFEHNENVFHEDDACTISDSFSMKELTENVVMLRLKYISGKVSNSLVSLKSNIRCVPYIFLSGQDISNLVLSEELKSLYRNQDFSDSQLKCGGALIPVHKNILSARSPVFKTILTSDVKESASDIVEIEDLDAETLSRFLSFLYSGRVGQDLKGRGAIELYDAADKYKVPSLKKICIHFLIVNVSASNACDVLTLGDKHQDCLLLYAAHNFILRNFNEFLKSPEWLDFLSRQPVLAARTLSDFAVKGYVGKLNTQ